MTSSSLFRLRTGRAVAVILALLVVTVMQSAIARATTYAYNGAAAVRYADIYSCNPNVQCGNGSYTRYSDDCANFVSQALLAGNEVTETYGFAPGTLPWFAYTEQWTVSWDLAYWMTTYTGRGTMTQIDKTAAYNSSAVGDFYAYDWGKGGGISHVAIEAGWGTRAAPYAADGPGDYIDQHTTDRYHAPWNYGYLHPDSTINVSAMKIYLVHLKTSYSG
jgi:hypothetical protein